MSNNLGRRGNYHNQGGRRGNNENQGGGRGRGYHQNQLNQGAGRGWEAPHNGSYNQPPSQQQWANRPPVQGSKPPAQQAWGYRPPQIPPTGQPSRQGVCPAGGSGGSSTGRPRGPSSSFPTSVQSSPRAPSQTSPEVRISFHLTGCGNSSTTRASPLRGAQKLCHLFRWCTVLILWLLGGCDGDSVSWGIV